MYVETIDTYVEDVIQHVERMRGQYPDTPSLLMGHSMVSTCLRGMNNILVSAVGIGLVLLARATSGFISILYF